MNPSFKSQLKEWQKRHQEVAPKKKHTHSQKPKKPKSERLSKLEIHSLMGINRATYRRGKGGAFRQH